jgi:hypothetical protein
MTRSASSSPCGEKSGSAERAGAKGRVRILITRPMREVNVPPAVSHDRGHPWMLLASVGIGLVLAIALSVAAVQRVHGRHRLEHALRLEAKQNLGIISRNGRYLEVTRSWLLEVHTAVEEMRAGGKSPTQPYPIVPKPQALDSPEAASWNAAKASGQVTLLPRDEARMYDSLYQQQSLFKERTRACADALDALRRYEGRFMALRSTGAFPTPERTAERIAAVTHGSRYYDAPVPGMSGMSSDDLREYSSLLNNARIEVERLQPYMSLLYQRTCAARLEPGQKISCDG